MRRSVRYCASDVRFEFSALRLANAPSSVRRSVCSLVAPLLFHVLALRAANSPSYVRRSFCFRALFLRFSARRATNHRLVRDGRFVTLRSMCDLNLRRFAWRQRGQSAVLYATVGLLHCVFSIHKFFGAARCQFTVVYATVGSFLFAAFVLLDFSALRACARPFTVSYATVGSPLCARCAANPPSYMRRSVRHSASDVLPIPRLICDGRFAPLRPFCYLSFGAARGHYMRRSARSFKPDLTIFGAARGHSPSYMRRCVQCAI